MDFGLWGGLIPGNLDELEPLARRGVVGFKAFMSHTGLDDFPAADDLTLYDGMSRVAALGPPVAVHAENDAITRGLAARAVAQGRLSTRDYLDSRRRSPRPRRSPAIELATATGRPLHIVHGRRADRRAARTPGRAATRTGLRPRARGLAPASRDPTWSRPDRHLVQRPLVPSWRADKRRMATSSSAKTNAERVRRRRGSDLESAWAQSPSGERHEDRWLARWMETTRDLARLQYSHRMLDAVIEEIDGRQIRIGEQWLTDYASCNYLGLDLDEEIIAAIPEYLARWGTHPSWSRLLGSPVLYEQIETKLTELLGTEDSLVLPTITHIHMSVIPVLAGGGTIFLDTRAHKTIYDGANAARSHGADVLRFAHNDLDDLEGLLREDWRRPGLICADGINSMTGNPPDLARLAALAREHDLLLYIDDAHGFGVIGERSVTEPCAYGIRGNSIVRHLGESYENVILVGGFSKAYSSLLAFIACPTAIKRVLKTAAPPYLYSGPSPIASLATVLEGLRVNEQRGDQLRARLCRLTGRVLHQLDELGIATPNRSGFPIIEVPLADPDSVDDVADMLFDRGIYATMAVYPLVPRDEVGFRLQLTAANTDAQVDHLGVVLTEVAQRFQLQAPASG